MCHDERRRDKKIEAGADPKCRREADAREEPEDREQRSEHRARRIGGVEGSQAHGDRTPGSGERAHEHGERSSHGHRRREQRHECEKKAELLAGDIPNSAENRR